MTGTSARGGVVSKRGLVMDCCELLLLLRTKVGASEKDVGALSIPW
jgi:hypothetical protein